MGGIKVTSADRWFSLYIRTRDGWRCCRCGKEYTPPTQALHCSHFKGRGKHSTRLDERNCNALCYGCHQYFTSQPDEHYAWQVERKGQELVDELTQLSNKPKKLDIKAEAKYWRERLAELG